MTKHGFYTKAFALILVLTMLSAGCNRPANGPPPSQPAAGPSSAPLTTVRPARRSMSHRIDQPGEIQAFEEAPIYPGISGYVKEVKKDIGDAVAEGEVLAELSVPEMVEKLHQKE